MPYTSNGQVSEQFMQQVNTLLHVLKQLSGPDTNILLSLPAGRILASTQLSDNFEPINKAYYTTFQLQDLLGIRFEDVLSVTDGDHQPFTGEVHVVDTVYYYTCKIIVIEDITLLHTEFTSLNPIQLHTSLDEGSYYNVFKDSTEPLFILDVKANFIDANQSASNLIDLPKEQLKGQPISKILKLNLFERVALKGQINHVLNNIPQKFEWWLHEKNDDLLPIEVSLRKGKFKDKVVILGSAKNLHDVIGTEQEVRYRNYQLEFINNLITNLSASGSPQEILKYTLHELLLKNEVKGGCIYLFPKDSGVLELLYSAGEKNNLILPASLNLDPKLPQQLITANRGRSLSVITRHFKELLKQNVTVIPIITQEKASALLVLWAEDENNLPQSFLSLLDFVGNAIGNYISRNDLMQRLSHTENKYRMLFEASYDAILLFKDGIVVDCNEKALQFFRCKREEMIGHSPDNYSPEYQADGSLSSDKAAHLMQQVILTGEPLTVEWQNVRKDGTHVDAEIHVNRIIIDGEYYVQAFKRDITQRKLIQQAKRREEVVKESMLQFHNFLEKVNLIHYSLDTKGNIVFANDYFLKYVEFTREELVGQNYYKLLVPEYERDQRFKDYQDSLETKHFNAYYERDLLTKSGLLKTVRWNCMFEYGPDGELLGVTSVGKDMTDKRIAMEALKDNKIRLQDLFDNAHDLIQNISIDNKFIFVNKAWKERLGYTDEDIESLTLNDIVHPYYKAKLIYQLRNLYKGENVNKIETVFLTKAGKPVHLIGSIICSWQDGKPVATRAILHDITDRIKAERLQKVYYSIANLAISSKDLNSLYSAIHRELSKIIETRNIYIALCDKNHQELQFVYLVDQHIEKTTHVELKRPFSTGLSEYIINTGKPLYMQRNELLELAESKNLKISGTIPEVILCSPLAIGDRIIGVITLQDYQNPDAYVNTDIEILHFISNQVALAIERKRNEEQINNQNAKLNAIFESGTHHMWSLNRHFELTSYNQNYANAFETRVSTPLKLFTKLDNHHLLNQQDHSYEFWLKKYKAAFDGYPQHFEIRLENPKAWREVFLEPIYLENGAIEELSGIAIDITDKKESQLALVENEQKYRHIFESFQDVYYRISLESKIELVSPSVYQLFGYTEQEVIGKDTAILYADALDEKILKNRVLREKSLRDFEVEMVMKDGTTKTVVLDARLVYEDGTKPSAIEGVVRDVSELKRTQMELLKAKEEAENLLKMKTQFLANMSHELRTPMNGIIGMIDLLSQVNVDPEQQEYIDTLRKSSDALLAILNDILDLSKMQAGKLLVHEGTVDLHDTLDKIHSLFANRAQQKDLTFTYHIKPGTPQYIITDETRLLQILSNLTSNAIKFTNSGNVTINVDYKLLPNDEYLLWVGVKDSGIGISPEDQQLLFTDFTQLDNSSTKTFSGTGLGLAISRQLTSLLGGEIGVDSVPEVGSTFWFTIKTRKACKAAIDEEIKSQSIRNLETEILENSPYVLLVDDNQINQKVAQKLLERINCRCDIASDGFEAIKFATSNKYNIIFMDIQMPEMDGITATRHIKNELGKSCPPIVAMTAYSMKDDAEKFMGQGMDDYVSKPVKSADLLSVINKWQEDSWYKVENENESSAEADADTQVVIDKHVVQQLTSIGGADFTAQLYEEFEQEAAELLEEAKKELQAQQYKSILSTLHQLKGTGFTLGINSFAELAKILEHDIKHDNFEQVEVNFAKLLEQYENYKNIYKDIII
jgi:PAS domain S-box-containing protein